MDEHRHAHEPGRMMETPVLRLFRDAQKDPELAQALGKTLGDLKEMAKVARDRGYEVESVDIIRHMRDSMFGVDLDAWRRDRDRGRATTLAMGEENGRGPGGIRPTTLAMGEEGGRRLV